MRCLVEVESADQACSEDGPLLGPPRLPVRPRSRSAVCAVVENGATTGAMIARTGAMIARTDAKSIVHSISDEIAQDAFAFAFSFSVLAGYRIYWPGHAARGGSWTPAAFKPV